MRRYTAPNNSNSWPHPANGYFSIDQAGFGKILLQISRSKSELSQRIVTTSPDVTVSTNLGAWVNRTGLFARDVQSDTFKDENIPSAQKWQFSPDGQHIELGIAEMNLFLLLGLRDYPILCLGKDYCLSATVYDPFISRGLDALNYACYMDSRFMIVGTPSGVLWHQKGVPINLLEHLLLAWHKMDLPLLNLHFLMSYR